jgi:dGTPase
VEEVRAAGCTIVTFSTEMAAAEKALKAFLFSHIYRHSEVMRVRAEADRIVRELFDAYYADPRAMPEGWREGLDRAEPRIRARHVSDFLAGMTDTYAIKEYSRLFDRPAELR